jgi:hypothetical protein
VAWILGLFQGKASSLPVERIGKTDPQAYPQEALILILSTSWEAFNTSPISGGGYLSTNLALFGILHSERQLSTKNRGLSTNPQPKEGD